LEKKIVWACFNIEIITTKNKKYRRGKGKARGEKIEREIAFFFIIVFILIFILSLIAGR
jgi:hypothetical protein